MNFDSNLILAIIIYLGSCYALYNYKHSKMFDESGNFKSFGFKFVSLDLMFFKSGNLSRAHESKK